MSLTRALMSNTMFGSFERSAANGASAHSFAFLDPLLRHDGDLTISGRAARKETSSRARQQQLEVQAQNVKKEAVAYTRREREVDYWKERGSWSSDSGIQIGSAGQPRAGEFTLWSQNEAGLCGAPTCLRPPLISQRSRAR